MVKALMTLTLALAASPSLTLECVMAGSTLATMWALEMNLGVGAMFRPLDRIYM